MDLEFKMRPGPLPGTQTVITYGYFDLSLPPDASMEKLLDILGSPISGADRGHHHLFNWRVRVGGDDCMLNISFGIGQMMFSVMRAEEQAAKEYLASLFEEAGILPIEEHRRREQS